MNWSDLDGVDDWDDVDDPPRRDPVRPSLLGVGLRRLAVDRADWE